MGRLCYNASEKENVKQVYCHRRIVLLLIGIFFEGKTVSKEDSSLKNYKEDMTWQRTQAFLPEENRLTPETMPKEYALQIDDWIFHIDHYEVEKPKGRIVLFHGVGGNGRLLSFIALPLWRAGIEVICPDLPLYGYTTYSSPVTYSTWVECGKMLVDHYQCDKIPVFVFGLSAGGMLAYQVASESNGIKGIIASCILDQRIPTVNRRTARSPLIAAIGKPLLAITHKAIGRVKIPLSWVSSMSAITNNRELARILMKDPKSSGARVPLSFVYTMLAPTLKVEPEHFTACPFLLVHPGNDHWTDTSLSMLFVERLACKKKTVILEGAGHFPIERTGLKTMERACIGFIYNCVQQF